jgi:hypothetical protein
MMSVDYKLTIPESTVSSNRFKTKVLDPGVSAFNLQIGVYKRVDWLQIKDPTDDHDQDCFRRRDLA